MAAASGSGVPQRRILYFESSLGRRNAVQRIGPLDSVTAPARARPAPPSRRHPVDRRRLRPGLCPRRPAGRKCSRQRRGRDGRPQWHLGCAPRPRKARGVAPPTWQLAAHAQRRRSAETAAAHVLRGRPRPWRQTAGVLWDVSDRKRVSRCESHAERAACAAGRRLLGRHAAGAGSRTRRSRASSRLASGSLVGGETAFRCPRRPGPPESLLP